MDKLNNIKMPPLKIYIFKHKKSFVITITLEIFGDEDKAWSILSGYVDISEWVLI